MNFIIHIDNLINQFIFQLSKYLSIVKKKQKIAIKG